jgi:hypothetical protein
MKLVSLVCSSTITKRLGIASGVSAITEEEVVLEAMLNGSATDFFSITRGSLQDESAVAYGQFECRT